ncbi:MAG: tryptophan-rich sensory protein [Crocinitomicaceae bacterium]|jgi:tryptophan-rich sensory protein
MSKIKSFLTFLTLNFGALLVGGLLTGPGVSSEWYTNLNQAPWTPPGWVFGFAWMTVMICFTFFMTGLYSSHYNRRKILSLFSIQWILNVSWNIAFFHFQSPILGLIIISSLTFIIILFLLFYTDNKRYSFLYIFPYLSWIIIATSLNLYIVLYNL